MLPFFVPISCGVPFAGVPALKTPQAGWQSGYAAACKAVDAGSIPTPASKNPHFMRIAGQRPR